MDKHSAPLVLLLGLVIVLTGLCSARQCPRGLALSVSCSQYAGMQMLLDDGNEAVASGILHNVANCESCGISCKTATSCLSFNYHTASKDCSLYNFNQRTPGNKLIVKTAYTYGEANCLCNGNLIAYDCTKYANKRLQDTSGTVASGAVLTNLQSCAACGSKCSDHVGCLSFMYTAALQQCMLLLINSQAQGYLFASVPGVVFAEADCATPSKQRCIGGRVSSFRQQANQRLEPVSTSSFSSTEDRSSASISACESNCRVDFQCSSINYDTTPGHSKCWRNTASAKVTDKAKLTATTGWTYSEETCTGSNGSASVVSLWCVLFVACGPYLWHSTMAAPELM